MKSTPAHSLTVTMHSKTMQTALNNPLSTCTIPSRYKCKQPFHLFQSMTLTINNGLKWSCYTRNTSPTRRLNYISWRHPPQAPSITPLQIRNLQIYCTAVLSIKLWQTKSLGSSSPLRYTIKMCKQSGNKAVEGRNMQPACLCP